MFRQIPVLHIQHLARVNCCDFSMTPHCCNDGNAAPMAIAALSASQIALLRLRHLLRLQHPRLGYPFAAFAASQTSDRLMLHL